MNSTLDYILKRYNVPYSDFIEIPNVGRKTLVTLLAELDFKIGVEVGVQRGLFSEDIARANPQMKVYGVDPWTTYVTCDADEPRRRTQSRATEEMCADFYRSTKKRMGPYTNYEILKEYSIDAVKHFDDESIDFVYIDGNHDYSFVKDDITEWSKKVKKGGIISGHDYYRISDRRALMHVKQAVDDYVRDNNIKPLIIWGLKSKDPGMIRDKWRSWSWVKQ